MVTDTGRRDRAQLILVGCVALAFVIISLGLLINTTIYTESSSQALSNSQVDSAMALDLETRRGTRSLIHRVNLGPRNRTDDGLNESVRSAVDNYSVLLGEQYARSRAAAVSVDFSEDGSHLGTRVIQEGDGDFYSNFDLNGNHAIGWFVINTNVSETDDNELSPFTLTIENGTGGSSETLDVEIFRNTSGAATEPNLTIQTTLDGDQLNATCDPRQNRVVLDVVSGQTISDGCTGSGDLYSISDLDPPITTIDAGTQNHSFDGKWEFITNRSIPSGGVDGGSDFHCDVGVNPAPSDACSTPAVWTANVTTSFQSDGATFRRTRNVTIYGADR